MTTAHGQQGLYQAQLLRAFVRADFEFAHDRAEDVVDAQGGGWGVSERMREWEVCEVGLQVRRADFLSVRHPTRSLGASRPNAPLALRDFLAFWVGRVGS